MFAVNSCNTIILVPNFLRWPLLLIKFIKILNAAHIKSSRVIEIKFKPVMNLNHLTAKSSIKQNQITMGFLKFQMIGVNPICLIVISMYL